MRLLFPMIVRRSNRPASRVEGHYAYLSSSARWEARRVRWRMQRWFRNYPRKDAKESFARLTSNDDNDFVPAFFELYLHQLFCSLGCNVIVHPSVEGSTRRPDFLIRDKGGNEVYVEAITPTEMSASEVNSRQLVSNLLDGIDRADFPEWFLSVSITESGQQQPATRRIRLQLENWLSSVDPLATKRELVTAGHESLPSSTLSDGDWEIQVTAVPRNKPGTGRTIGSEFFGVRDSQVSSTLCRAIRRKASRYGQLDRPYIVAVNLMTVLDIDHHDVADGLFGSEVVTINRARPTKAEKIERQGGGALLSAGGPVNTRVSGVFVVRDLSPWTVAQRDAAIFENPYASRPLRKGFPQVTHWRRDDNELRRIESPPVRECMGVPEGWPEILDTSYSARAAYFGHRFLTWVNHQVPLP